MLCAIITTASTLISAQDKSSPMRPGFSQVLPAAQANLKTRAGGTCFLDAINFAPIGDKPAVLKAGAGLALGGWVVADVSPGRLGTAPLVKKLLRHLGCRGRQRAG